VANDLEKMCDEIILMCPTTNSVKTGREVLMDWPVYRLKAFHKALKSGLLEREISATAQARNKNAWERSWALAGKFGEGDAAA